MLKTVKIDNRDLGLGATIDTYNTFTSESTEDYLIEDYNSEHGTDCNYDDFEWTYHHDEIVKELAEARAGQLARDIDGIASVKVLSSHSPDYYNFTTDWFVAEFTVETDTLDKIVKDNLDKWNPWYMKHWLNVVENAKDKDNCYIVAQLDFIINELTDGYIEEECVWSIEEQASDIYFDNIEMEKRNA